MSPAMPIQSPATTTTTVPADGTVATTTAAPADAVAEALVHAFRNEELGILRAAAGRLAAL